MFVEQEMPNQLTGPTSYKIIMVIHAYNSFLKLISIKQTDYLI